MERVLLIDDQIDIYTEKLKSDFLTNNIDLRFCTDADSAIELLDSQIKINAIVLDWFLEEDSSELSQLFLVYLDGSFFIPVFIWSEHMQSFNALKDRGEIKYPPNLIKELPKEDFGPHVLRSEIENWYSNSLTAQLSIIYRDNIHDYLEKILFKLADLPTGDIASILKIIIGSKENIDWSIDLILNLLHRELISDLKYVGKIHELLTTAEDKIQKTELDKRREVINALMYFKSGSQRLRCGDIIQLEGGGANNRYGIVVSPDCDLEWEKTRFVELVEIIKISSFPSKPQGPAYVLLPAILMNHEFTDFSAVLKSKIIIEYKMDKASVDPKSDKKLEYTDIYIYNGKDINIELICCLDNPYKSDFLQKVHAHNSRIGIPNIKELLNN